MRLVLVYDVVDDTRRARLHRRLQRHLVPVQLSVFEGEETPATLDAVVAIVQSALDLEVDDVRVYRLCEACAKRVQHHGVAVPVPDPDTPIVI